MNKKFRLIVIGDEILSGRRQDKHLASLIGLLTERGLSLSAAEYVADDPTMITDVLRRSFATQDVVFCTGGIGATPDDHTRECVGRALDVPLELHLEARDLIAKRIEVMAKDKPELEDLDHPENLQRFKMGEFPVGSHIIPNSYNSIPGFSIQEHYFLPGFPVMAHPMMAWVLNHKYSNLFHSIDFIEKSFIVPGGLEAHLTPLMVAIESTYPGLKVFSLPSIGDNQRGGIYAQRHIELGVKGKKELVDAAYVKMKADVISHGYLVHEIGD